MDRARNCFLIAYECVAGASQIAESGAPVVVCSRIIRSQRDRFIKAGDRFVRMAEFLRKHDAAIIIGLGIVGIERNASVERLERAIIVP